MKLKIKKISLLILTLTFGLVTVLGFSTTKVFANQLRNYTFTLENGHDLGTDLEFNYHPNSGDNAPNFGFYLGHEKWNEVTESDILEDVSYPNVYQSLHLFDISIRGIEIKVTDNENKVLIHDEIEINSNDNRIRIYNGDHNELEAPITINDTYEITIPIYEYMDIYITEVEDKDNKVPVISGETTFVSNVADPKDASYFMQFLSAYDETDGDVTSSLKIIQDNYTANKSKLGNHTFTVEASDNSGNKTTTVINVRVVDIDKPVITGNSTTATIGYKETYNIENFRKTLTVTDNYDQMTNADIKLKTDGYTSNKTKLGTYNIVFHAKDSSGNEGTFSKDIKVIDNIKPTFSGPSVISTSNNTILTEAEIRAKITAHDDIDGNITNRIELVEDNYTGNGNKVGSYTIKYSVKDNANNIEYYVVTIQRTDKIPPTIWVEDGVSIRTNVDTPITYEIIIDILQATGQITVNASTTFSFPLDEYTGNEQEPGIYAMSVKARSTNGNESIFNMSIVVYDTEDDGGIDVNPDFSFPVFLKDNWYWFAIGAVGLIGVVAISTRKRR